MSVLTKSFFPFLISTLSLLSSIKDSFVVTNHYLLLYQPTYFKLGLSL